MVDSTHNKWTLGEGSGSPHLNSYQSFRKSLDNRVFDWLSVLLCRLRDDGHLDFKPEVGFRLDEATEHSPEQELGVIISGGTLRERLEARIRLADGIGIQSWAIGDFPLITRSGSFIIGGSEYFPTAQFTNSPGVFFTWEENYETRQNPHGDGNVRIKVRSAVARLRPQKGLHLCFRKMMDTGKICVRQVGGKEIGLDEFQVAISNEGSGSSSSHDITRQFGLRVLGDAERASNVLREQLLSTRLGSLGRAQLNRRMRLIEPSWAGDSGVLTESDIDGICRALDAFSDQRIPEDDPWDLGNLYLRLIGDRLDMALEQWFRWMERGLLDRLQEESSTVGPGRLLDLMQQTNGDLESRFTRVFRERVMDDQTSRRVSGDEYNFLKVAALARQVTFKGPGRISVAYDFKPRDFHWSHYGRLCPLDTPMGNDIGVTTSLALGARVNDLGIIESRCRKVVQHTGGSTDIEQSDAYVSPWEEIDPAQGWVAFPDQREALIHGQDVYSHKGRQVLKEVGVSEVSWIHSHEADLFSMAANLIPYRAHNDPARMSMACNFLRQALPLKRCEPPRISTGFEEILPSMFSPLIVSENNDSRLAFGADLFTGYMPWKGYNFADAIVISESAAEEMTNINYNRSKPILLHRSLADQEIAYRLRRNDIPDIVSTAQLDGRGIIKVGECVQTGDLLVFEPAPRRANNILHPADDRFVGEVIDIAYTETEGTGPASLMITVKQEFRAQLGDKLATRHGHKGVIGKIFPDYNMPYILLDSPEDSSGGCLCGETRTHRHLQVLINPLSVISRMNLGQLYETVDARDFALEQMSEKVPCFDPTASDGSRELDGKVLVGRQYIMKLDHNAADKIHGRATGGYTAFAGQPLKGRRMGGGQRLGEMEVWALLAHNVPALLQEMLTIKSDNPRARLQLLHAISSGEENETPMPEVPDALRTLTACLYGLGLEMTGIDPDKHKLDPVIEKISPDVFKGLNLSLLNTDTFRGTVSRGEVTTPIIRGSTLDLKAKYPKKGLEYHPEGLESERIFGPVRDYTCACGKFKRVKSSRRACDHCGTPLMGSYHRRRRMGHIALTRPVPNPYVLLKLRTLLGMDMEAFLLRREPRLSFQSWKEAARFCALAVTGSSGFRSVLEKRAGAMVSGATSATVNGATLEDLLDEETRLKLRELYFSQGGMTVEDYIERSRCEFGIGATGRRKLADELTQVLRDTGLCTIDFLVEILTGDSQNNILADTGYEHVERLCLTLLPVLPPGLRRPFETQSGKPVSNDVAKLYEGVLRANAELDNTPYDTQEYCDKRFKLQLGVAQLMCNEMLPTWLRARSKSRQWRSLSSFFAGKKGLLLGNLLGKRVDYSGRAVIVPDPELPLDSCRLPLDLAIQLFKYHLVPALHEQEILNAREIIERALAGEIAARDQLKSLLQNLMQDHPVLLNRQPTLHRLGMLAFNAEVWDESVIAIPPLVTAGYNADFDGDQMAVYLPLGQAAREDARKLFPSKHLWHPADGRYALSMAEDLALGGYLLQKKPKKQLISEVEALSDVDDVPEWLMRYQEEAFRTVTRIPVSVAVGDLMKVACAAAERVGSEPSKAVEQAIRLSPDGDDIKRIVLSGARGDWDVMAALTGQTNASRSGSNLTQGLQVGECLERAIGGRRNLVGTKLTTAEGGSLSKEFVANSHHLRISNEDCGTTAGIVVSAWERLWLPLDSYMSAEDAVVMIDSHLSGGHVIALQWDETGFGRLRTEVIGGQANWRSSLIVSSDRSPPVLRAVCLQRLIGENEAERNSLLYRRLYGRKLIANFEEYTAGVWIDIDTAEKIAADLVRSADSIAEVRSPAACKTKNGLCKTCSGLSMAYGRRRKWSDNYLAGIGDAVGIIASQTAGEPGTQMALRKKHLAGSAEERDVALGLRVVKEFLKKASILIVEDKDNAPQVFRDTLDYLYRGHGISIAPVHLETLFAGYRDQQGKHGWIGDATRHTDARIHDVLVNASLRGQEDSLQGFKERVILGALTD